MWIAGLDLRLIMFYNWKRVFRIQNQNRKIHNMVAIRKRAIGISLLLLTLSVALVSAYVYETGNIAVTQTIKNIATLTVQNSGLGNIEEGQTITYTKGTVSSLGNILNLTTTKASVVIHFASNVNTLNTYYSTYTITVKYAVAINGHVVGDTLTSMTIASPNPTGVTLAAIGAYQFDFEITTTALSVSSDQASQATITFTAEST
jgi:hypothetical protein